MICKFPDTPPPGQRTAYLIGSPGPWRPRAAGTLHRRGELAVGYDSGEERGEAALTWQLVWLHTANLVGCWICDDAWDRFDLALVIGRGSPDLVLGCDQLGLRDRLSTILAMHERPSFVADSYETFETHLMRIFR